MNLKGAFATLAATLLAATAQAAPVSLWRLDCGKIVAFDLDEFSDTRAYVGQHKDLVGSCYLIRHGETYMLWDTGLPRSALNHVPDPKQGLDATLTVTIVDQLAKLGIKPDQIALIGISHEHFDHTGQASDFPGAILREAHRLGDPPAIALRASAKRPSRPQTLVNQTRLDSSGRGARRAGLGLASHMRCRNPER